MKNSLLKVALATMFTLVVGYTTYTSQKPEATLSSLAMENIEALAQGEVGATCTFTEVKKNQIKNELICKGKDGSLCCVMN